MFERVFLASVAASLAVALLALTPAAGSAAEDVSLAPDKKADTVAGQPAPLNGEVIEDFDQAIKHPGLTELLVTDQTITGQPLEWGGKAMTMEMYRIVVPPGAKSSVHKHNVPFIGYLKQGTIKVVNDKLGSFTVEAGETIVEVMGTYQQGENIGDEPAVIYGVYLTDDNRDISQVHPDADGYVGD